LRGERADFRSPRIGRSRRESPGESDRPVRVSGKRGEGAQSGEAPVGEHLQAVALPLLADVHQELFTGFA